MTFTKEQVAYLESLPAVEHVGVTRITYSDAFRRECLERYHQGERPTELFRKAGLDPKLVGRKRIERCFARWREQERLESATTDRESQTRESAESREASETHEPAETQGPKQGGHERRNDGKTTPHDGRSRKRARGRAHNRARERAWTIETSTPDDDQSRFSDPRDMIIAHQALLIDELEHEIEELRHAITQRTIWD